MTTHHIAVSEELYLQLQAQAARLQLTPEQVIAQLLGATPAAASEADAAWDEWVPLPGSPEALEAAQRLTTLFADTPIPNLDQVLDDPAIAMANASFGDDGQ